VPSLSKLAMRSGIGTKSGEPGVVTFSTKVMMDCFVEPSFHDGNGLAAMTASVTSSRASRTFVSERFIIAIAPLNANQMARRVAQRPAASVLLRPAALLKLSENFIHVEAGRLLPRSILARHGGAFGCDFVVAQVLKGPNPRINRVFTLTFPSCANRDRFFADEEYRSVRARSFEPAVGAVEVLAERWRADVCTGNRAHVCTGNFTLCPSPWQAHALEWDVSRRTVLSSVQTSAPNRLQGGLADVCNSVNRGRADSRRLSKRSIRVRFCSTGCKVELKGVEPDKKRRKP
jgi:hypothetical protein